MIIWCRKGLKSLADSSGYIGRYHALGFLVFLILVITIAWDDGFANRNRAFDDAFGGFVGDFGRGSDDFMHAAT